MVKQVHRKQIGRAHSILAAVAVVAALYFARDFFIPIVLAILFSFLLSPIVEYLQRKGLPNIWSVILTVALVAVLLGVSLVWVGNELRILVVELPNYKMELIEKVKSVSSIGIDKESPIGKLTEEVMNAFDGKGEEVTSLAESNKRDANQTMRLDAPGTSADNPIFTRSVGLSSSIIMSVTSVLGPLGFVGLVAVFVIFLLVDRDRLKDRLMTIMGVGNLVMTTEALDEVSRRISRYLLAQSIINFLYGICVSLGLFVIGKFLTPEGTFPNIILWGVLAGCCRFVPYIGPVVGNAFPVLMAFVFFPGYNVLLAVASLVIVLELVSNNVLEPWLYGSSTGLSAVAIIVSAVFWGWIWGPVGVLLSTPMTVCLLVVGKYVPAFSFFETILADTSPLPNWMQVFHRLLTKDKHKLLEFAKDNISKQPSAKSIDDIVIPVMKRIEHEKRSENLTDQECIELHDIFFDSISSLWDHAAKPEDLPEESSIVSVDHGKDDVFIESSSPTTVLSIASHNSSEEVVLKLLGLTLEGVQSTVLSSETVSSEFLSCLNNVSPAVLIIGILPDGGLHQALYWCQMARDEGYQGTIMIACFGKLKNYDKQFVNFRKRGANYLTTSAIQLCSKLNARIRSTKVRSNSRELDLQATL